MSEKVTQTDLDSIADIIWWIKGYQAGARDNLEECPFNMVHYESLRKARLILQNHITKEK